MYRQLTIGCLRLNYSKTNKQKKNTKKSKLHKVWAIPIPICTT